MKKISFVTKARLVAALAALTIASIFAFTAARGGEAETIPAGQYVCEFNNGMQAGSVEIRGATYRAFTDSGDFKPYSIGGENAITWSAGFGEFNVVSSKYMGVTNGRPTFFVTYSRTRGGGVDRIDCQRE